MKKSAKKAAKSSKRTRRPKPAVSGRGQSVYFFGDGKAEGAGKGKELLGGKGSGLAEMTALGVPVPPGFTISTEVCAYWTAKKTYPPRLESEVARALARVEKSIGKRFGDPGNPLLVSVRSGARASMPGMMDTILNLGINTKTAEGFARLAGERSAADCRRRFIQMYGDVVLGVDKEPFEKTLAAARSREGVQSDAQLSASALRRISEEFQAIVKKEAGRGVPEDPEEQLWGAIGAVFGSWNNERAKTYRRLNKIPEWWGTAVNVQSMVFGNLGDDSATGVAFTRNPSTGEKRFYGEYLPNAQGEDVVAGIRTPHAVVSVGDGTSLEETMPKAYRGLLRVRDLLEKRFHDMQDLEFTIERGKLYLLQTRTGKRTGFAAVRMAVEMVGEKLIDIKEAVRRVEPEQLVQLLAPIFPAEAKQKAIDEGKRLARGLPAGPGAACGRAAFTAERAVEMSREKNSPVVLVRTETSPEDIAGMHAAVAILTSRGGMTSHAAVVARGMGKTCVVGCGDLAIDEKARQFHSDSRRVREGDFISIDGTTGEVMLGQLPTRPSEVIQVAIEETMGPEDSPTYQAFAKLLSWADRFRRLGVRANADTPTDARVARRFGAAGIGLCRTEHMFFDAKRIAAVREMILSDTAEGRRRALSKILPMQREDFVGIFREMGKHPVTIRLLDPPLHEFLPHEEKALEETAKEMGVAPSRLREKVRELSEANPMLGHRGCRLGLTHPEIYETQVRAVFEAAARLSGEKEPPAPEIMIPLVGTLLEFTRLREMVDRVGAEVEKETRANVAYKVGTMIEIPRAALRAEEIGRAADFFSFGTNDLTQMTFGFSRDDIGSFLPDYLEMKILPEDPFASIDRDGVGQLVRMGWERGLKGNAKLKVGICGEHGGDPASIEFFDQVGLDYVSCSPYRVPVARLSAARAALAAQSGREA